MREAAMATAEPFADALEAATQAPAPGVLAELRSRGRESFDRIGLPDRRQEKWRFTRLSTVTEECFVAPAAVAPRTDLESILLPSAHVLVFVDGVFDDTLSDVSRLPDGVVASNRVLAAASGSAVIDEHLGALTSVDDQPFAALNSLRDELARGSGEQA